MTQKEDLHRLVDELPESGLAIARRLLEELAAEDKTSGRDTLPEFLEKCDEDDEPTTEDDLAAAERGRRAALQAKLVPHDVVVRWSRSRRI